MSNEKVRTPEDWGRVKGYWREVKATITQAHSHFTARHACAAHLHGWAQHAYHYPKQPMLLTEADYEAALEAAANYPNVPPHAAALSPVKG